MPINEVGEFVRTAEQPDDAPEVRTPAEERLTNPYLALAQGGQSSSPQGVQVPEGLYFWLGERLAYNAQILEELKGLSEEAGTSELVMPGRETPFDLGEYVALMDRSVAFSKEIDQRNEAGEFKDQRDEEEMAKVRRALRDSMLKSGPVE